MFRFQDISEIFNLIYFDRQLSKKNHAKIVLDDLVTTPRLKPVAINLLQTIIYPLCCLTNFDRGRISAQTRGENVNRLHAIVESFCTTISLKRMPVSTEHYY